MMGAINKNLRKQFIFLRFGMNNFTFDWFKWRLSWFQYVSLQSLEMNANESMYVVIFINRNIPVQAKRELNRILESSSIRAYSYIVEIDFANEVKPKSIDFVRTHTEENERVMITRLDMDDGYSKGLLLELDNLDDNENQDQTVLYSIAPGYRFAIEEKKGIEWDIHFRGLNMFLFTCNREETIWEFSHFLGQEYADDKGWKVVKDYSLDRRWYRSECPDNTDVTVWEDKYLNLVADIEKRRSPVIEFQEFINRFSLDKERVEKFYSEYQTIPYTSSILVYDSWLTKKCTLMRRDFNRLVDIYCESIPRNINEKPKTEWNIRRVQDEKGLNFLQSIEDLYSLSPLEGADVFLKHDNFMSLVKAIPWKDYIVTFSARGNKGMLLFEEVTNLFVKNAREGRGLLKKFLRNVVHKTSAVQSGGGAIAVWGNGELSKKTGDSKIYYEQVISLGDDALTRARITSSAVAKDETAQMFIGDSNTHTWTSEVDYSLNKEGVNVAISPVRNPGRVIDAFLISDNDMSLRRRL